MAIETMRDSDLRLVFETGLDLDGNMTYKNKNYNNVKTSATADQLAAVATSITGLQQHPLFAVRRYSSYEITN